jgi:hypothetical protein
LKYPSLQLTSSTSNATSTSNKNNSIINNKVSTTVNNNKQNINSSDTIKKSLKNTSLSNINITNQTSRILLVHDPPVSGNKNYSNENTNEYYENTNDNELRRTLLCNFNMPVIMILSDISGKDDMQYNVTKIIPHDIRNL